MTSRTPPCPYAGQCGGCQLQHLEYGAQLEKKRGQLGGMLSVDPTTIRVLSGAEFGYRNRMDFIFHKGGIGLRGDGGWSSVFDVPQCLIATPQIQELLTQLRQFFAAQCPQGIDAFDAKKKAGTFRYAVIRSTSIDTSVSIILNTDSTRIDEATQLIEAFARSTTASHVVYGFCAAASDLSIAEEFVCVKGDEWLHETIAGKDFQFPIQGFFQNNSAMATRMIEATRALLVPYQDKRAHLLDLYGGVGTFGIVCSDLFGSVSVIESVAPAIACAKENLQTHAVKGEAKVLDAMQIKRLDLPSPLIVITDPPRSGMHKKTIDDLNRRSPNVIIYISCNPQQLARELPLFSGYERRSITLVDMFPQTNHMEVIVELVKKNNNN